MSMRLAAALTTACVLTALAGHVGNAQARPSYAFDATIGDAEGHGGEFFDTELQNVRLAASVRSGTGRHLAPYAELGFDWLSFFTGHDAVCPISTRGGCKPPYPDLRGPEMTAGLMVRPASRVEMRGGIGAAMYSADGHRAGGLLAQADGAVFITQRFGAVVGTRLVVVPRFRGDRLWTMPWSVGLRIR